MGAVRKMVRWTLAGLTAAIAAVPAPAAAAPAPGLWVGTKGDVQLSFTVRADGRARRVTDVTTFCGANGAVEEDAARARSFAVRGGRIANWAQPGERAPHLGADAGVVDARTFMGGDGNRRCGERDFEGIRVRRGDFRPIRDGEYRGETEAYRLRFTVAGGGMIVRDVIGYAGVPDPTTLTGYCGSSGALASTARIGAGGAFTFDDDHGGDSRLVIRGTLDGSGAAGSYDYSATTQCVGSAPLAGTVSWTAALTQPAPGAAPPGGGGPPSDPSPAPADPKPTHGSGYDGPPAASQGAGCSAKVEAGPIEALAACFRRRGTRYESAGRVRLNGIDLTPTRRGVRIAVDRRTFAVTSDGPVELRIGSLSLLRARLDWRRPDAVFEIEGTSKPRDRGPAFRTGGQRLFGLPVKGSARLRLEGGRTKLTVTLAIPRTDGAGAVLRSRLAGAAGELTAAADNDAGLVLDGAKLTFPGLRAGFVEVQAAELAVSQVGDAYHFDGGATIFPFRFNRMGFDGRFGFGVGDGYVRLGAAVEQLNRALVYGFFVQRIGFEVQGDPFGVGGDAGVTFGPQFRLDGDLVSAARLDGALAYLSASGDDPAALELRGELALAEAKAADGEVSVRGDGEVTAKGSFALTVGATASTAVSTAGSRGRARSTSRGGPR